MRDVLGVHGVRTRRTRLTASAAPCERAPRRLEQASTTALSKGPLTADEAPRRHGPGPPLLRLLRAAPLLLLRAGVLRLLLVLLSAVLSAVGSILFSRRKVTAASGQASRRAGRAGPQLVERERERGQHGERELEPPRSPSSGPRS